MIFSRGPLGGVISCLLCLGLTGCSPWGENRLDEQKEPHFLTGKKRMNSLDYKGAVEAFEKALEANPQSASAHFELALLFEQKEIDYAAAVYHYDRFSRLPHKSDNDRLVTDHINYCKQELAKTVSIGPVSQAMQRDLERLRTLDTENAELKRKLAIYESRSHAVTNVVPSAPTSSYSSVASQLSRGTSIQSNLSTTTRLPPPIAVKTHSVTAGENPTLIAKKYGISVAALLTANPSLDAKRLRIGQTLNIPAH